MNKEDAERLIQEAIRTVNKAGFSVLYDVIAEDEDRETGETFGAYHLEELSPDRVVIGGGSD